jgi:hypothetical protein
MAKRVYMRVAKIIISILLMLMGSLIFIGTCKANNKDKIPILAVTTVQATNPPQIDIGQTLTVNVSVIDVTDLYTWQVKLSFNNNTLEYLNAIYPSDHVFAGKPIVPVTPLLDYDSQKKTWYVLHGCSLMGSEPGVNGSGTLCQIMFKARALDGSYLNLTDVDTYLLDSDLDSIPFTPIDSNVIVVSEFSSVLMTSCLLIMVPITIFYAKKFAAKKKCKP